MRSTFHILATICLLGASLVFAQYPGAVGRVADAKALWDHVHALGYLPRGFNAGGLQSYQFQPWRDFVKKNGQDIFTATYHQIPQKEKRKSRSHFGRLARYAHDPSSPGPNGVINKYAIQAVDQLIESYATHQEALIAQQAAENAAAAARRASSQGEASEVRNAVDEYMSRKGDDLFLPAQPHNH
ncbi:uncharacterized protein SRS1_11002 [Sporisorium reilianum f. sp. reilianum]|uniref:Uncharacterized protein n=1 Tax=Sporisorium reilianum f. sp. reilianum TaxID=72559 RepID=A0A2N8UCK9_9BASI|nr:uncharacterized protein SRS1_11002 [Sporisorium reilianum f. sp. reilianum]